MTATADRVKETTTTTGTGTYSLAGAATGFRHFSSAFSSGQVVFYCCEDGADWEIGEGTLTTGTPDTLARTTILASSNFGSAVNWSAGSRNIFATLPKQGFREVLTAARTYYVRSDGNDSNNGLANTSGGAFLTIQKAVDVVCSLDCSIYQATIQLGDATYNEQVTIGLTVGKLPMIIQGNSSTPTNVVINGATCITVGSGAKVVLKNFKLTSSSIGLNVAYGGYCEFSGLDFGACTVRHMQAAFAGTINITGNYTISGGSGVHFYIDSISTIRHNGTCTLSGTPAFSTAFIYATSASTYLKAVSGAFSGSATGVRYTGAYGAVINTGGGGANFFPGNSPGSAPTAYYI